MTEHRPVPSAEKQQRRHARHRDHVRVFRHEEHGKLHRAVLGVVPGDQFGFGFRQVKRDAVRLRIRRHQIAEEADELPGENIPARNESPEMSALRIHNARRLKLPDMISTPTSESPSEIS